MVEANQTVTSAAIVQDGADVGTSDTLAELFKPENYNQTTASNINEMYDKLSAADYEQFLVKINFTEPFYVRDYVVKSSADGGVDIAKDAEIMDFGCGTGIVGYLIKDHGYTNIYGLDASDNFIKIINEKGIYKGGEALFLGQGGD